MTPVLEFRGLSRRFERSPDIAARVAQKFGARFDARAVQAVDAVDLAIKQGEVVGLVGESGCGKSTLGRMAAGLIRPSAGQVLQDGRDVSEAKGREAIAAALKVQMVFQDPSTALNPRHRVEKLLTQAPVHHGLIGKRDAPELALGLLDQVGLGPSALRRFPHQFSGGQRQRLNIARALAVDPEVIVADEAVASLDVSIQAQVINLFLRLREERRLTYLFISHDLGVVEHVSDRIVVMYLGRVVEVAPTERLFSGANHPYTGSLIAERPRIRRDRSDYTPIKGELPSPLAPPPGCHFHTRCPLAKDICRAEVPRLKQVATGHLSACHLSA